MFGPRVVGMSFMNYEVNQDTFCLQTSMATTNVIQDTFG